MGIHLEPFTAQQFADQIAQLPVVVDDEDRPGHARSDCPRKGAAVCEERESARKEFVKRAGKGASSVGTSFASWIVPAHRKGLSCVYAIAAVVAVVSAVMVPARRLRRRRSMGSALAGGSPRVAGGFRFSGGFRRTRVVRRRAGRAGVRRIRADWQRHAAAARDWAGIYPARSHGIGVLRRGRSASAGGAAFGGDPYVEGTAGVAHLRFGARGSARRPMRSSARRWTWSIRAIRCSASAAACCMQGGPLRFDVGYRYKRIMANSAVSSVLGIGQKCSRTDPIWRRRAVLTSLQESRR